MNPLLQKYSITHTTLTKSDITVKKHLGVIFEKKMADGQSAIHIGRLCLFFMIFDDLGGQIARNFFVADKFAGESS